MLEVGHVAMQFLRRPRTPTIRIETPGQGAIPYVAFDADAFEVEAAVDLRGNRTDARGARLGWTQLQTVDVNRAVYRGATPEAGHVEVNRDRSPSATARLCRDVMKATDVFTCPPGTQKGLGYTPLRPMNVDLTPVVLPAIVRLSHADKPGDGYFTTWDNKRTHQPNYLSWASIEMQFCVVLLLKHRSGALDQLGHFYWSLQWEDRFEPVGHGGKVTGIRRTGGDAGNRMAFKPFATGPVTDGHLASLIAAATGQTCNERAYLRNNDPEEHHHARW